MTGSESFDMLTFTRAIIIRDSRLDCYSNHGGGGGARNFIAQQQRINNNVSSNKFHKHRKHLLLAKEIEHVYAPGKSLILRGRSTQLFDVCGT